MTEGRGGDNDGLARNPHRGIAAVQQHRGRARRHLVMAMMEWMRSVEGTAVRKARRIALIGLRGAGKSSLGAALAERADVPFIEMSKEIERACGEGGI